MTRVFISIAFMLMLFAVAVTAQFSEWSAPVNLGPVVNSPYTDSCVTVSKNGLRMFFFSTRYAQSITGDWHLYVSQRPSVDAPWGEPQEIVGFNDGYHASCPVLSLDEHRLFFASPRPGGCGGADIWVSRQHNREDDFGWGPPVNLGCMPDGPNSPQNDNMATVFEDDTGTEVMYFSSNRPGGPGAYDIYESRMGIEDTFGPSTLVAELSTFATDSAAVRRDGLEAIIMSNRPGGTYPGTTDLWTATREDTAQPWSEPIVNPILNSPGVDGGRISFSFDGRALYFQSNRPGGYGAGDLYVATREKLRGRTGQ